MELYIGGAAQNKLEYVKRENSAAETVIINNLHTSIKEKLSSGLSQAQIWDEIQAMIVQTEDEGKKLIFISDEIGNGIVPADPFERQWREVTGRILCSIAALAQKVVRIVAGLAQVIKG